MNAILFVSLVIIVLGFACLWNCCCPENECHGDY